jgi:hypothetical protein
MTNHCLPTSRPIIERFAKARGIPFDIADVLKYEIDKHLYYYGNHFRSPYEEKRDIAEVNAQLTQGLQTFFNLAQAVINTPNWVAKAHTFEGDSRPSCVCNAYFSWGEQIERFGYRAHLPLWQGEGGSNEVEVALRASLKSLQSLFRLDFRILCNDYFIKALTLSREILKQYYAHKSVEFLMVPTTIPFFEAVSTQIFRELDKPSFLAINGLPTAYYWNIGEFPVDYYVVWGDKIRDGYIRNGMEGDKLLVSGHPNYSNISLAEPRFSLDNVLVGGRPFNGAPSRYMSLHQNRGFVIDHVHRIQIALRELGVNQAVLRPHPVESPDWYEMFVDESFWRVDRRPLSAALNESTLVIGPPSTMFLDALMAGVNYSVLEVGRDYNPGNDPNFIYSDPFDGSNPKVPVAQNEVELFVNIRDRRAVELSVVEEFVKPGFTPEVVLNAL